MSVVQRTYNEYHDPFQDGQVANTQTCDIDSVTAAGDIAFGRMVHRDANGKAVQGVLAGPKYAGIAVEDQRLPAVNGAKYKAGDEVSVLWRGDIAVKVSAAVNEGDDVVVATAASGAGATAEEVGQLSSKAPDGTHLAVAGLFFRRKAAAQGISVVRVASQPVA